MKLEPFLELPDRPGALWVPSVRSTRDDGVSVTAPLPVYAITSTVAAAPTQAALGDDGVLRIGLGNWALRDLRQDRLLGLTVQDPDGATAMRIERRYATEAAHLDEHALAQWASDVAGEGAV